MKVQLFISSDECLEFSSRSKAFIYADKNNIKNYCLLSTGYLDGQRCSVFNSYLIDQDCVEYFDNESSAMKYIGSFL